MSRTQQKGREGSAEPGGSWQDQDCLSVSPAAGWDDVSADPHPGRPGSCFSLKVVSKGAAALTSAMHRHSRSCCSLPAALLLQGVSAKGCVCYTTVESCVWQFSCGRNLTGVIWAGSTGVCKKRKDVDFSSPFYITWKHLRMPATSVCHHTGKTEVWSNAFPYRTVFGGWLLQLQSLSLFNFSFKTCF